MSKDTNYHLDITNDLCPLTFVRTKLAIEKMASGETLEVRLKGEEPLRNVPKSVRELGHLILSLEREETENPNSVYRLRIKRI